MGQYFSQIAGWLSQGAHNTFSQAPRDAAAPARAHAVNASPTEKRLRLEADLHVLKLVQYKLDTIGEDHRRTFEALGVVAQTMGTYDRDHAGEGVTPEGAPANRAIRRRFDNTQMAQNIRQLLAALMAAHRETEEARQAYTANPGNAAARQAWRAASDREAVANGNYGNYGNGTPFMLDSLRYRAATSANAQVYSRTADGLVGLRDLLQDYDESRIPQAQLLQGIRDIIGQIETELAHMAAKYETGRDASDIAAAPRSATAFERAGAHVSAALPSASAQDDSSDTSEEDRKPAAL